MVPRRLGAIFDALYERLLQTEIDEAPTHVAVIQDGNRRYARKNGEEPTDGHRKGAQTTADFLDWCHDHDVEEVTLYAFSTENFERPTDEREALFDLIAEKLTELAESDEVHENEVHIRIIGDVDRLPERVREAVDYATERTAEYDTFMLNIALAYGGRWELLNVAREICRDVAEGRCAPDEVDVDAIEQRIYDEPMRAVDLIIRTGGDERTSNFLPWHANGNEAAVFFCAPYWPEFSKIDFLRGIRTYQYRQRRWEHTRTRRAFALVRAIRETEPAHSELDGEDRLEGFTPVSSAKR